MALQTLQRLGIHPHAYTEQLYFSPESTSKQGQFSSNYPQKQHQYVGSSLFFLPPLNRRVPRGADYPEPRFKIQQRAL